MKILALILGIPILFGAAGSASADDDIDPIQAEVCSGDPDRTISYYDSDTGNLVWSGTAAAACAYINANYSYLLAGTLLCEEKADKTCKTQGANCTHPTDGAGRCETKLIQGGGGVVFKRCRCTKQSRTGGLAGPFLSLAPLLLLSFVAGSRRRATATS